MNILAGLDIIEMISSMVSKIMGFLGDIFLRIFFSIAVRPLFKLMDTFIDIMLMLAGVNPLDSGASDSNLITTFLQSKSISNLYMYIAVFSAVLIIVLAIYQIIKQDFFSEDGVKKSHSTVIRKLALGLLYIIAIPPIFLFAVSIVSQLFQLLWNIDGVNQLSSLSQTVFELALSKPEWMIRAELVGESTSVILAPIPHWSVITADQLATLTTIYDFNFVIFIGVLGVAFYSMFMLAFAFAKRIFRLVLLYAIGPIAVAQSVTDDSKFAEWRKDVIKEMISVFGTLISLVIFVIFCTEVNNITFLKNQVSTTNISTIALFNMVIKALFMLVGFSVIRSGDSILTKVVGGQMSISDGESSFSDVKKAASAATKPYALAGKGVKAGIGAAKGVYNTGYNLAAGIAKTSKAVKKAHENGQSYVGALFGQIGEKQREKWHNATKLDDEDDYKTMKSKNKEKATQSAKSIYHMENGGAFTGAPPGSALNYLNEINSGDAARVETAVTGVRNVRVNTTVTRGITTVANSEDVTSLDAIFGTGTATVGANPAANVSAGIQGATSAQFATIKTNLRTQMARLDSEEQRLSTLVSGGMASTADIAKLAEVRQAKQTLTTVQQAVDVRVQAEQVVTEYRAAQTAGDKEGMKAAEKAATDLAKKDSV